MIAISEKYDFCQEMKKMSEKQANGHSISP
jgi:hypothetical protein